MRFKIWFSRFAFHVHPLSRFLFLSVVFMEDKYPVVSYFMLPDVFLFGCRLSESGGLVFSVSCVARTCCLEEVCFLIILFRYLGDQSVVLDAAVRRSR
jgi:hypothetical protein